ncbi:MAG: c-type cytochrome [Pirellulaceae bacterium]
MIRRSRNRSLLGIISLYISAVVFWPTFACQTVAQDQSTRESESPAEVQWDLLAIPDSWKKSPGGRYASREGHKWFRSVVQPPRDWEGNDLTLFVEAVDDAREVYFNGKLIGSLGTFPPEFRSGLGVSLRFKIPANDVLFGEANLVALRVYERDARSNFNVAAPVLFGGSQAIRLAGVWQATPGDNLAWAKLSARNKVPVDATYATIISAEEAERTLKQLSDEEGPLSVAESRKRFQIPDDLAIDAVLSEPHIGQPLSIKWDARGRLWVMQYLQYPNPAGLTMISRDKFLRSVYDKVPPPPPHHFPGADKISVHEDTDGDGQYDSHKTFVEGLSLASSFALDRNGLWVLNPPYLLFYPDANQDDRPDGDPEVHLEGFGIEDSHSVANSLRWGPDGWLYAAQGSTVTGDVRLYGSQDPPVHSMGQLIWRYHPPTRRYEIFAEGGGNTFGVEVDSKGRIYSGHNGGDTRGFHYVQGGYFQKGFGKHGDLSNPYSFGYFPQMKHHSVPRFTHTFLIYESHALPPDYQGKLFGVGPLQGHVVMSQIEPDGSTFRTKDTGHPLTTDDTWFRPVDIQEGPDGAIYVADFYEQRIDHASHYQGRVTPESGRVYRLRAKDAAPGRIVNLERMSNAELIEQLRSPIRWTRQTALRLLGQRRNAADDTQTNVALKTLIDKNTDQLALEALWALHWRGGLDEATAAELLDHDDPHVRLWTVRLMCDDGQVSPELASKLTRLAESELNVETRSQIACSARRLPADQAVAIVERLLRRTEDISDPHIPLLLWWAIEAHAESHRDSVLTMFDEDSLWEEPLVKQHILERLMRRYAQAGTRRDLVTCAQLLRLAPSKPDAELLLKGFETAYQGRSLANLPDELLAAMAEVGGGSLALRLRRGEVQAIDESLRLIADEKSPVADRVMYVGVFGDIREPRAVAPLLQLATTAQSVALRAAALTALQSYDSPEIGVALVRQLKNFPAEVREVALSTIASRPAWTKSLLTALESGDIPRDDVPLVIVRKMLLHSDRSIAASVGKQWGSVEGANTVQMQQDVERFTNIVNSVPGNPYTGKALFGQHCGKCHTLFGQGGQIGPDLTSFKRDDLRRMVVNIVNPSLEIREGFENFVILTDDGRALNGFIADQDNQVVVLKSVDGQSQVIARDSIEEMRAIPRSVMPEGILKPLDEQQIRDLFAYLRAAQPLP